MSQSGAKTDEMSTSLANPLACEASPTEDAFVPALAIVLTHLVTVPSNQNNKTLTRFHAVKAPDITIRDYLDRIQKYFGCTNECFVLSLVYIDRIVKVHKEKFSVSILNIHRLLITSVMLAAKFFDDVYYSNAFYARVGGVKTREINILETHFLSLINYQLFVSPQEYDQYRKQVVQACQPDTIARSCSCTCSYKIVASRGEASCSTTCNANGSHQPPYPATCNTIPVQQLVPRTAESVCSLHGSHKCETGHVVSAQDGSACQASRSGISNAAARRNVNINVSRGATSANTSQHVAVSSAALATGSGLSQEVSACLRQQPSRFRSGIERWDTLHPSPRDRTRLDASVTT